MAASALAFSDLPDTLPVFPLTGALLLPGGQLPLNIFETRYIHMFRDAMATPHRLIGMVQARNEGEEMGGANIYDVGCAGRLTAFSETDDGRFLVTLSGLIRFDILEELSLHPSGYRRARPDFLGYDRDLAEGGFDVSSAMHARFVSQMRAYFDAQGLETDWQVVERVPPADLVTSLAMACPFSPSEKQALLDIVDRFKTLEGLLVMGALDTPPCKH